MPDSRGSPPWPWPLVRLFLFQVFLVFFYNEDAKCFFFLDIFFFLRAKPLTVCRTSYIYVDYTGSNIPPVAENMKLKTGLEPELARNLN